MTIRLTNDVYEKIQRHGEKDYPHECCGFLIGRVQDGERIVEEIREQKNERNTSQTTRFLISPKAFKDAEDYARDTDQEMLGIYHSHPDHPAEPSQYDLEHAWPWYSYLILSVPKGEAGNLLAWQMKDDRSRFDAVELELEILQPSKSSEQ